MIEIAMNTNKDGILQKDIAANQKISNKYLDIIIHSLKKAGLIKNVGGKKSGYILTRKPGEISMFDIHVAFESGVHVVECLQPGFKCQQHDICAAKLFWCDLNTTVEKYLKKNTLADLIKEHKKISRSKKS